MSKFRQFITKYSGKYVEHEGVYIAHCVDLVQKYAIEVLGIGAFGTGNAIGRWENYPREHFERITNTPSFVPQFGDIMIWGKGVGQYGHIAIVIDANVNTFDSFDQNWPVGSPCKQVRHTYTHVLGVLRFRNFAAVDALPVPPPPPAPPINTEADRLRADLAACRAEIEQLTRAKSQMDVNYQNLLEDTAQLQTNYDSLEATNVKLAADLTACESKVCEECEECPPATVPVIELPVEKPHHPTLEDLILSFFRALRRLLSRNN